MNYETLLGDTRMLIERVQPQVVLVDGVVDYVASFNDEMLSRQLINELMLMAQDYHCAIVCVLHENKASDDENMRGHLGTVLAQKAGTVLQCHKSKQGIITVSCPDSRHGAMPEWSICYDAQGHMHDADEVKTNAASWKRNSVRRNVWTWLWGLFVRLEAASVARNSQRGLSICSG